MLKITSKPTRLSFRQYFHAPAIAAGFAAVLIGYSSSAVIVFQAAKAAGAALLATSLGGISMAEAIGAFLFSAVLITLSGVSGWFERIIDRIPLPLTAAMLAGILFQFGIGAAFWGLVAGVIANLVINKKKT